MEKWFKPVMEISMEVVMAIFYGSGNVIEMEKGLVPTGGLEIDFCSIIANVCLE